MVVALLLALAVAPAAAGPAPEGAPLYFRHCAPCHGIGGSGDGPDASLFLPPPRNLHKEFLKSRETSELIKLILDGARRPLALDPRTLRARLEDTKGIVTHLEKIPHVDWRLVELGQDLYTDRCADCHGSFGRPPWDDSSKPAPRDLSTRAFQEGLGDDQLVRAVRHERRGMPAIPVPPGDADARALVAFVRVLSPGFEVYSRHCASCHGNDGHPQREFVEPRQRPTVVFDRSWLARRDPVRLRAAVSHMLEDREPAMPHFRTTLSEPEVRAILRYLQGTSS